MIGDRARRLARAVEAGQPGGHHVDRLRSQAQSGYRVGEHAQVGVRVVAHLAAQPGARGARDNAAAHAIGDPAAGLPAIDDEVARHLRSGSRDVSGSLRTAARSTTTATATR